MDEWHKSETFLRREKKNVRIKMFNNGQCKCGFKSDRRMRKSKTAQREKVVVVGPCKISVQYEFFGLKRPDE